MAKVSFLGCGSWGAAMGNLLASKGIDVTMWHRNPRVIHQMDSSRQHYLVDNLFFTDNVSFNTSVKHAISNASIVVLALPSQKIRSLIKDNLSYFRGDQIIVTLSKGIEIDTLMTVSDIINEVLSKVSPKVVALSGPSHAEEVVLGHPTALVAASECVKSAKTVQKLFAAEMLRTYLNKDIKGVELGGAMKNVIAIAAGICDGIGYGDNSKAALMTRGMSEISQLGKAMGAKERTFRGLSGYGDLIVTCLSKHSRNRKLGQLIGEGQKLSRIVNKMNMIAEGVSTAKSVHQLSARNKIEMPIHEGIYKVLFEGKDPKDSVYELMNRKLSEEKH